MSPTIRIDEDVFRALQQRAVAFVDTPNDVLRRVLGLQDSDTRDGLLKSAMPPRPAVPSADHGLRPKTQHSSRRKRGKRSRAAAGTILPESEYVAPLLQALIELGGRAPANTVIDRVGKQLDGRLTESDRETLGSGVLRWKNRVQFVRLRLVREGLMADSAGRGVWEITASGRQRARTL
jgi:hypothetical protein